MVSALVNSGFRAVYGTRAVKCTDLSDQLKRIYGNNRKRYVISKYGGMALSLMTLLLYNRYVTDVLTSSRDSTCTCCDPSICNRTASSSKPRSSPSCRDAGNTCLKCRWSSSPAPAAGKKIRTSDGLRALWALWRFRLNW